MSSALAKSCSQSSADKLRQLDAAEKRKRIEQLTEEEAEALLHDWHFWARPNQLAPPEIASGEKSIWLILAGRGFGKTRTGAEQVREWVKDFSIVNLIGPTAADVRDTMVQGIGAGAAIMEICGKGERPTYEKSNRRLVWPNGAISMLFSAEEPERLRGPQHQKVWADEIAAWKYPGECWEQMDFGLRLGSNPQVVATTTPKPIPLIKQLLADPETVVTSGSTYDNKGNLAKKFLSKIVAKYEGTRLGRQELHAEVLLDNPGALWTHALIDRSRVRKLPELWRAVVGVDPSVSSGEDAADTGIIVAGIGPSPEGIAWPPHFYILDDLSTSGTPNERFGAAIAAYNSHKCDRIVAEINNGGDLVEAYLRGLQLEFAYRAVHASRGKVTRAEPIAALYEQNRVHHVGSFGTLEDQMCDWTPASGQSSPDRMDALVWALWALTDQEEEEHEDIIGEDIHISPELDELG